MEPFLIRFGKFTQNCQNMRDLAIFLMKMPIKCSLPILCNKHGLY